MPDTYRVKLDVTVEVTINDPDVEVVASKEKE